MKGHIRLRSAPDRWAIVIDIRDPETGQRKRMALIQGVQTGGTG
jgi:hypothetical protein